LVKFFLKFLKTIYYSFFVKGEQRIQSISLFEQNIHWKEPFISSFAYKNIESFEKTFNLPFEISALSITSSTKGITNKNILFASNSGLIYTIDARYLNPEISFSSPMLPVTSVDVINPELEVLHIKKIISSSSPIESTSRISAFGLDFFHTTLVADKPYDKLRTDFDVLFLFTTIFALFIVVIISSHIARQKTITKKWNETH